MVSTQELLSPLLKLDASPSKSTTPFKTSSGRGFGIWPHGASNFTLAWLIISIPLVVWDAGYVLLRPLSMPGGSLHSPLWVPYEIYMRTDYVYGWKALEEKNGFTSAQGTMNIPETLLYLYYLYLVFFHGTQSKAMSGGSKPGFFSQRYVRGQAGALAVVVGLTAAVMTLSKTLLYGLNEAFSGWSNVGHNERTELILYWIIPNGTWLVASALMSIEFGSEILQGLSMAAGEPLPEKTSLMKALRVYYGGSEDE